MFIYYQCQISLRIRVPMTTQIRIFQKFQPQVERGQLKNCQICGTKFSVFAPEHQCKRCLRAVCSSCGSSKRDVYKPKMVKSAHRLCKICSIQSTILSQYSAINKLKFAQDSQLASKWAKKLPKAPKPTKQHSPTKQNRKFTLQIFNQLWDSYNFSLRQFIGLHTFAQDQANIYKNVNKVYINLQENGVDEKMQNVIYLIIFLLCFSSVELCGQLVQYILMLKKQVSEQKQFLQAYLKKLGLSEQDMKKISDLVNYSIKHYLGAYSLNAVTSQCSIHVISKTFEKQRIDQSYMLLAVIIFDNYQFLEKFKTNKALCDYQIIRKCDMSKYLEKFKGLAQVKISQFVNIEPNNTLTNKSTSVKDQNQGRLRQSAALNPASIITSSESPPPRPILAKHQSLQSEQFENSEADSKITARQRALQNIAKIKAKNAQLAKQEQKSQQSIDNDELYKETLEKKTNAKNQQKSYIKNDENKKKIEEKEKQIKEENDQNIEDVFAQFNKAFLGVKNIQAGKKEQKEQKEVKNERNKQQKKQKWQQENEEEQSGGKERVVQEKGGQKNKKQPIIYYEKQQCEECNKKEQKLQQLSQQIRAKTEELQKAMRLLKTAQNQLQKLQMQVKQEKQKQQQKQKQKKYDNAGPAEELEKLKTDFMEGVEKYNTLMKNTLKLQKQNQMLKNEVEETLLNNKILKSKLEQASMGVGFGAKSMEKEEQLSRENVLLKRSVESKNKQLQVLSKKNRELSGQIEQLVRPEKVGGGGNKQEQKWREFEREKQELMKKMKQLGQKIVKEEEEKLGLSCELFELKRSQSLLPQLSRGSEEEQPGQISAIRGRVSQCNIF